MPNHAMVTRKGRVTDIFAHRFVLKTSNGNILADLGPDGVKAVALTSGDEIELEGEVRPSEVKVLRLTRGSETFEIAPHKADGRTMDEKVALKAVVDHGYDPVGAPRRRPKHFEILGRKAGVLAEFHVEGDGHIRKAKPIATNDEKWKREVNHG